MQRLANLRRARAMVVIVVQECVLHWERKMSRANSIWPVFVSRNTNDDLCCVLVSMVVFLYGRKNRHGISYLK
jgi:hypothetical protein